MPCLPFTRRHIARTHFVAFSLAMGLSTLVELCLRPAEHWVPGHKWQQQPLLQPSLDFFLSNRHT